MTPSAAMAPEKMVTRACRIAMIAAMKNVLSPNSETIITLQRKTRNLKRLNCEVRHLSGWQDYIQCAYEGMRSDLPRQYESEERPEGHEFKPKQTFPFVSFLPERRDE